jgi:hypothetical protein
MIIWPSQDKHTFHLALDIYRDDQRRMRIMNEIDYTHCMATLPSILPTANASPVGKQLTTLVCHFRGDS